MHIDNKRQIEQLTGIKVIAVVAEAEKDLSIYEKDLIKIFE
jgi:hypothetical protein